MTPLQRLRLEKAGSDCGFEMTAVPQAEGLALRSARFPELVQVRVAGTEAFEVSASDPSVLGVDAAGDAAIDWGVYGAPETFLIGPDGTVLYKHIAPLTLDVWRAEFLPRIAAVAAR